MNREILTRVSKNSKLWVPAMLVIFLAVLAAGASFKFEYSHRSGDGETQISVELQ